MTRRILAIAVACAASAVAFGGDSQPPAASPATKEYASDDKKYAISMPASWTVSSEKKKGTELISLSAELPDKNGTAYFELRTVPGCLDLRGLAARRGADMTDVGKDGGKVIDGPSLTFEPMPQALVRVEFKEGVFIEWLGVRMIRRSAFALDVGCAKDVWPKVQDACLAALRSLKTTLPEWPDPPRNHRRVVRDGYEYYVHPSVEDADLDAVHKRLRAVEAAFVKQHGPTSWTEDAPFVVVVHATREDAVKFDAKIDGHSRSGSYADGELCRLSVVPPPKGASAAAAELACAAWRSFVDQTGMDDYPFWLYLGEGDAAAAESLAGKPLPALPDGMIVAIPNPLPRLDEIAKVRRAYGQDVDGMLAWVAFFRCGPKPWRDAFAAFLQEGAASHDWAAAEKKNLLAFDQEKLRDAAQAFLAKGLTAVKTK